MDRRTRRIELRSWMMRQDISQQMIADALGISRQRVSTYLGLETMTRTIWRRFVDAGVPEGLLPEPRDLMTRGPKPRAGKLEGVKA